jgi:hypothetical protein
MAGTKNGTKATLLEKLLGETSRRILHAMALPPAEAEAEWLRAAACEKEVACLLDAGKQDVEAATHYVSAASCYARAQRYSEAVPLLRSALSFSLRAGFRSEVETLLKKWAPKAKKQLRQQAGSKPATRSRRFTSLPATP